MNKKVLSIIKDVRRRCEDFAHSKESEEYDFHACESLDCMCAVASFALHTALRQKGFKSRVVYGTFDEDIHHCWVEWRGMILDITASQFGMEPIHIVKKSNELYHKQREFFRYNRFFHDWENQKPSPEVSRFILSKYMS